MSYNANFESIGQAFVAAYYQRFDVSAPSQRATSLAELYDANESIMTFEGTPAKGKQAILAKFQGLTFRAIQRAVTKVDSQPCSDGAIIVYVLGQLKTDDDPHQSYSQVSCLPQIFRSHLKSFLSSRSCCGRCHRCPSSSRTRPSG